MFESRKSGGEGELTARGPHFWPIQSLQAIQLDSKPAKPLADRQRWCSGVRKSTFSGRSCVAGDEIGIPLFTLSKKQG